MPVSTTLAILGAAGIGAASSVASSNANAKSAKSAAAKNAATIANTQAANTDLYKPYEERGNAAGDRLNQFLGLSPSGTAGQDSAFNAYKDSTGYKFQLDSGSNAIASQKAAQGLLKSGSALKSLTSFGQGTANTYTQNYLSNLQNQQNAGLTAAGGNASSNSNAAGMSVNNNNNALASITQARTDSTNALTNLLGNAVSAYGYSKGASSYTQPKTTAAK